MVVTTRRRRFIIMALPVWVLALMLMVPHDCVQAQERPHLIQTVTDQEIYEGMLALGLTRTPVLEAEDCGKAYENVKTCVVRIQMGNAHGSGIVWAMTPEKVVIATNRHVLEYWDAVKSYVYFPQGYYMDAQISGVDDRFDIGFLTIDNGQFTYDELMRLHCARIEEEVYDRLARKSTIFCVDSGSETEESAYYEIVVENPRVYIDYFNGYMLYGHGFVKPGMSGGGAFDGRGYLLGMTTGGTQQNDAAFVPLSDIIQAYEEIMGEKETDGQTEM